MSRQRRSQRTKTTPTVWEPNILTVIHKVGMSRQRRTQRTNEPNILTVIHKVGMSRQRRTQRTNEPSILTDIHEPLLNTINSPEEGRTAESSKKKEYRRQQKTEIVVKMMRVVLTPTTVGCLRTQKSMTLAHIAKSTLVAKKPNS